MTQDATSFIRIGKYKKGSIEVYTPYLQPDVFVDASDEALSDLAYSVVSTFSERIIRDRLTPTRFDIKVKGDVEGFIAEFVTRLELKRVALGHVFRIELP